MNDLLKKSLFNLIRKHGKSGSNPRRSLRPITTKTRKERLMGAFNLLEERGFVIKDVKNLSRKHMVEIINSWHKKGLKDSTIKERLKTFRLFEIWIGKPGLVSNALKNSRYREGSKRMIGKNPKVLKNNIGVKGYDERVKLMIQLISVFGLRPKEAAELRPHSSVEGNVLNVNWQTHRRRDKQILIDTIDKEKVIEKAQKMITGLTDTIKPSSMTSNQWMQHFYYRKKRIVKTYE